MNNLLQRGRYRQQPSDAFNVEPILVRVVPGLSGEPIFHSFAFLGFFFLGSIFGYRLFSLLLYMYMYIYIYLFTYPTPIGLRIP